MMPMSPMDAQIILKGAEVSGEYLGIGYRRALETCAGMHEEWGVSYRLKYENEGRTEWGWVTREDAERSIRLMSSAYVCGIVRRYVTDKEKIS